MIRGVKRTKAKRTAPIGRIPKGSKRKRFGVKRPPDADLDGDWDNLDTRLRRDLHTSRNSAEKLDPLDRPEAILKRYVYHFVRKHLAKGNGKKLEHLLWYFRTGEQRAHRIRFEDNPFHWALAAIPTELSELSRPALTKIGRQLLYADRHDIEPDLLIGFILQTGDPDAISKKAKYPDKREDWYLAKVGANKS